MSSASTRRNENPGVMNSTVLPASSPVCATVSSTLTVVVPTASTRRADEIAGHGAHRVPLSVNRVLLQHPLLDRAERVEPDMQRDAHGIEALDQLTREVEPGSGRAATDPLSSAYTVW